MRWFNPNTVDDRSKIDSDGRVDDAKKLVFYLADYLDEIGAWSSTSHKFVCEMIEKLATQEDVRVSTKQLAWLRNLRDQDWSRTRKRW